MKIAIEGMDGSGKSTIAKEVAQILNYTYLEKALKELLKFTDEEFETMCNQIYSLNDENIKALFFGLSNLISLKKDNVIIDKHILGTYFWNKTNDNKNIFDLLVELGVMPDLTIIIYASQDSRIRHIKIRNSEDKDLLDSKKMSYGYDKMLEFAINYNMPYFFIDGDNMTLEEIVNEIVNIINYCENKDKNEINEYKEIYNQKEKIKQIVYKKRDKNEK